MRLLLALVATLSLMELGLRYLLFGGDSLAQRLGAGIRQEAHFAGPRDDVYWKLRVVLAGELARPHELADPRVGWISRRILPGTFQHRQEERVGARRPVLVYGDSFAHCKVPPEDCWAELMENSAWSEDWAALNYGVEGYGFDQTVMLMLDSIDSWAERDPFVIVSVMLDDDLDRSMLTFRGWSKPRFERGPQGQLERNVVAPEDMDPQAAARPLGVPSYLYRLFLRSAWVPEGLRGALQDLEGDIERTRELNAAILERAHSELLSRDIEHCFLLFHGSRLLSVRDSWREEVVLETLQQLGAPYVSTRSSFDSDRLRFDRQIDDYFIPEGPGSGHYNPIGNRVAFGTLQRALLGMHEGSTLLVDFADVRQTNWPEELRDQLYRTGPGPEYREPQDHWRLVLPVHGDGKPTSMRYAVWGPAKRFRARLRPAQDASGTLLFTVRQEEELIFRRRIQPDTRPIEIDLELQNPESIALTCKALDGQASAVVLSAPWVSD